jgi:hypothetical protein
MLTTLIALYVALKAAIFVIVGCYAWSQGKLRHYLKNNALAGDQSLSVLMGGDPDMTLSGRMGRAIAQGRCSLCKPICWLLGRIERDHCAAAAALEADEGRDQVTPL